MGLLEIKPLAFDSFGARSMATFVETEDVRVLIDAGVSLAPDRYRLPPHDLELKRREELWNEIKKHAEYADILIITHYHYDHHDPSEPNVYSDKTVYIKHPLEHINKSQKERASYFLGVIEGLPRLLRTADGKEFRHGSTVIKFSEPVFHGTNERLGYVIEVCISSGGEKMVFTSDVEGPSLDDQISFPLREKPDTLIVDGPMTYMLGFRYPKHSLDMSIQNLKSLIDEIAGTGVIIIEHHLLRDLQYKERISEVYKYGEEKNVKVITAAEYMNRDIEMLEARRKELYEESR